MQPFLLFYSMVKRLFIVLLAFLAFYNTYGQTDSTVVSVNDQKAEPRHVRISLLTVGQGEMVWEAFGHSCIRVTDSMQTGKRRDLVYNYGSFDNFDQDFAKKLIDGTLLYYLSVFPYDFFINVFVEKGRSIEEQVFLLNDAQRTALVTNLENNALPRNKYYQYDFFTDNCSTRIYNMVGNTMGKGFVTGAAIPRDAHISFYEGSNQYYFQRHWERVGVTLLFEHRMNQPMNDGDVMFLPYYLSIAFNGATLNGKKFCSDRLVMAEDTLPKHAEPDMPFVLTATIAVLTIIGLSKKRLRPLGKIMSYLVLLVSGLLGCIFLYAWLGTDHKGCEDNLNLLWALPTNIIIPFLGRRVKSMYALPCIGLLGLSFVLYMLRIMVMPLFEITPFLLALLWVYAVMYRQGIAKMR